MVTIMREMKRGWGHSHSKERARVKGLTEESKTV